MSDNSSSFNFINPAQQTPLFISQYVTCAYPISDFYASTPRYLYYALLLACILTQWHPWLANVFLGAAATYAGTAAIQAFIMISHWPNTPIEANVTIPVITSAEVQGNATLSALMPNLIVDSNYVPISPYTMDLDIDPILAITVTATLFMLPMHCWSSKIRKHRAIHLLMGIWNGLTLAGTICALVMWPRLYSVPDQFRFCYTNFVDAASTDNDGWQSDLWQGSWNATIWDTFQNANVALGLSDNCVYPCFNTSQILRQSSSITATLSAVRTDLSADASESSYDKIILISNLVLAAILVTTVITAFLLIIGLKRIRQLIRVPIHQPRLLWGSRKELLHVLRKETKDGFLFVVTAIITPKSTLQQLRHWTYREHFRRVWHVIRFILDVLALFVLLCALILCPVTIVAFLAWIEWYIHRDIVSNETPAQVGQWSGPVSIGLVLVSACVLRLKYVIASRNEVEAEMNELREKLDMLETLRVEKESSEQEKKGNSQAEELKTVPNEQVV